MTSSSLTVPSIPATYAQSDLKIIVALPKIYGMGKRGLPDRGYPKKMLLPSLGPLNVALPRDSRASESNFPVSPEPQTTQHATGGSCATPTAHLLKEMPNLVTHRRLP